MNVSAVITDNVTDVLNKILEFTERRKSLLTRNIVEMNRNDYTPMDLDTDGFAQVMTIALSEHICNQRLMLCDSDTIKFGPEGEFELSPVEDSQAGCLLRTSPKDYVDYQIHKLSENWLNRKLALALLRKKKY